MLKTLVGLVLPISALRLAAFRSQPKSVVLGWDPRDWTPNIWGMAVGLVLFGILATIIFRLMNR